MYARLFETRFGWMAVASRGQGLSKVILPSKSRGNVERLLEGVTGGEYDSTRDLMALESDLVRYYNGRAVDFTRYSLDFTFSTGFQKRVWMAVHEIPYGKTLTYGQVAARIGESGAARAVGNALNANPLPVLVPCHRVVGARGVGGFSGGPTLKKRMLKLEGVL
jgi:methylated-DNA-[protein]-cysteine S-methyltransferase